MPKVTIEFANYIQLNPNVKNLLLIGIVVITLSIWFGSTVWFYLLSIFFGRQDIVRTAEEISPNAHDPKAILEKIADWEDGHMTYDERRVYFYPVFPLLFWRIENPNPAWIVTVKRGGCEEYAILFSAMANSMGIKSRVVYNSGEDHVWSEVLINGSWRRFDSTLPKGSRFDDPGFYERPRDKGGWGKQLSYVYAIDSDGSQHDVTSYYTKTGKLIITVKSNNLPVEDARVIIESRFLMESEEYCKYYKGPLPCLERKTNASGICTFDLGGNNYTVIAELGMVFGKSTQTIIQLKENDALPLTLVLSGPSILLSTEEDRGILCMIIAVSIIALFIIMLYLKRSTYRIIADGKGGGEGDKI